MKRPLLLAALLIGCGSTVLVAPDAGEPTAPPCHRLDCDGDVCQSFPAAYLSPCDGGLCSGDGVCLPACSSAADCPTWLTSECRVAHCEPDGVGTVADAGVLGCSNLGAPAGKPCDGGVCNGAGACCDPQNLGICQ